MQQTGIVRELLPHNRAKLQVQRVTACGHDCSTCGGCIEVVTKPIYIIADNSIHAEIGETVQINGSSKSVLGMAAILYVVPVVLFFLLYGIAAGFGLPIPGIWGGVGFFGGIFGAKLFNDYKRKNDTPIYQISRL